MEESKTGLERYCTGVLDGSIVACRKIKKVCGILLNDLHAEGGKYHFDKAKADRAVSFIEGFCKIPAGKIGQPFALEDYERAIIEAVFGFVDDSGIRRYTEVLIIIARKNGKTSLAAAIELYMLIADGEGAPQVYNVATKEEQASLGFRACMSMMRQSQYLKKYIRKRSKDLYCDMNMGYIKSLSSNTTALDGLDIHCAIIDELAAIRNRDLYDLVKQGMSARAQPLLFEITTNGFFRNGIFDAQYDYASRLLDGKVEDERFLPFVYELDDRDEWLNPDCWKKANPGLGTVKKESALRDNVNKAKNDPTFKATVMTKDFNMPENSSVAWLNFEEAVNEATFDIGEMGFKYGIVGFDASDTIDLTAAQMLLMRPGDDKIYELSMYWIPEDVVDEYSDNGRRRERDDMPYKAWIDRGLMRTVPGNKIDKRVLLDWLNEIREEYNIYTFALGLDPWHMTDSQTAAELQSYVGKSRYLEVRQGAKTLSEPMKQIRVDYGSNRIVDNHNPINEWCRMNVMIKADANGNIQPYKKELSPKNRIDGFAAELDAYVTLYRYMEAYKSYL